MILGFFLVPFLSDFLLPCFFRLMLYSHLLITLSLLPRLFPAFFWSQICSPEPHFAFLSFLSQQSSFFHLYPIGAFIVLVLYGS